MLIVLTMLSLFVSELIELASDENSYMKVFQHFTAYRDMTSSQVLEIPTSQFTIAGRLHSYKSSVDVDTIARISFYAQTNVGVSATDSGKQIWYPAKRCNQMYDTTNDSIMETEFSDDAWICPDIESITLNNDPWYYEYGSGQNIVMVVNQCDISTTNDGNQNI